MKKLIFLLLLTLFSASISTAEMTLLKRTVQITPKRFLRYWKTPAAAEPVYNTYSWVPKVQFDVLGPVSGSDKIFVEFDTPDGKQWLRYDMRTPSLGDDELDTVTMDIADEVLEKKAIVSEGLFPFRIKLKPAAGAETTLFAGKIRVGTYLLDQKIPEYKGKKDFYIDYDWHLPLAYVWLNPISDADVPQLATQVCLRGNVDSSKLQALLFFNGKEISQQSGSSYAQRQVYTSAADEPSHRWAIWEFSFARVRGFNKSSSTNSYDEQFFLDKNPGEYEIRITRDGQPARSIKFTVGADGKIVDNMIAKNARLGGVRMIMPAKILGTGDGTFNAAAWQTDALFANPPAGFSAN